MVFPNLSPFSSLQQSTNLCQTELRNLNCKMASAKASTAPRDWFIFLASVPILNAYVDTILDMRCILYTALSIWMDVQEAIYAI